MAGSFHGDSDSPVGPGDVIDGKYRVERVIGIGGMGAVVDAARLDGSGHVAVKVMLTELLPLSEPAARFTREARAVSSLASAHTARVFDVGKLESGEPYIVMELLHGRDLQSVTESGKSLSVERAVDYVLQACDAIAEAHSRGIIHRDLKPANLFVTTDADGTEVVKVLDFGISKVRKQRTSLGAAETSSLTGTTTMLGSPSYMAPEQLRSAKKADERSDIWALGVILHELLTGGPLWRAGSFPDLCLAVVREPTPPLRSLRPDAPPELEAVVARCLEKDPADRFQTIAELTAALEPFALLRASLPASRPQPPSGGEPDSHASVASATAAPRPAPPRVALWASVAVLIAVAAGLAVWLVVSRS